MSRLSLLFLLVILTGLVVIQATPLRSDPNPSPIHPTQDNLADQPVSSAAEERSEPSDESEAESPAASNRRMGKHSSDKSVAGGGVIIGGLVTAIFAAVFCYIRVTRKRNSVV